MVINAILYYSINMMPFRMMPFRRIFTAVSGTLTNILVWLLACQMFSMGEMLQKEGAF